jgi:putative membrane protein
MHMLSKKSLVLAIALAFPAAAAAGPGTGETKTDKTVKKGQQRLSEADLSTLQHHHDVNLMEIDMGKLAQQRGGPEVKKYAAALVKDHQTADKTAINLAKARGVTLSTHATPMSEVEAAEHEKQMQTMERLKSLEGSNFDREYLTAMVDGHSAELGYLTVAIADASDAKLKAHLEKVRPVVEKHADQARDLLAKMNGNATTAPAPGEMKSNDAKTPPKKPATPATPTPKSDETTPPAPAQPKQPKPY